MVINNILYEKVKICLEVKLSQLENNTKFFNERKHFGGNFKFYSNFDVSNCPLKELHNCF